MAAGYICVRVCNKLYLAHRIIWEMHNGKIADGLQINHKNHDRADNSLENLELLTPSENYRGRRKFVNSSSAYKGVHWHKRRGKWQANVRLNGKHAYLGMFSDEKEAAKAVWNFYVENGLPTETLNFYEDLTLKQDDGMRPYDSRQAILTLTRADPSRKCIISGTTENTVCHHIIPHRERPDLQYEPNNLVWIREDLHVEYHSKYKTNINRKTLNRFIRHKKLEAASPPPTLEAAL
jgi:hypothetical protein